MGLYTPTILGGNSYLSWFYDRGAIKDPAHTGTSKRLSQAIHRGPNRKFLPKYADIYVTIQSHGLSAGARPHYVTANGVRNGLAGVGVSVHGGDHILVRGDGSQSIMLSSLQVGQWRSQKALYTESVLRSQRGPGSFRA